MELKDRAGTISPFCNELEQAFEFLMSVRLRHQFRQMEAGVDPDNYVDPDELGILEKCQLREAFQFVLSVQEAIRRKYRASMIE
jgi:CBS domain-containing protein